MKVYYRVIDENRNRILGYLMGTSEKNMSFYTFEQIEDFDEYKSVSNAKWQYTRGFVANKGCTISRKLRKDFTVDELHKYGISKTDASLVDEVGDLSLLTTLVSDTPIPDSEIAGVQYINLCRRIRQAIRLNTLVVDTSEHVVTKGRNLHFEKLLKLCNMSFDNFVKSYLTNLQPCTLRPMPEGKGQGSTDFIAIYDTGYKVRLYLKFKDKGQIVVSFHEDNISGKTHATSLYTESISSSYAYLLSDTPITAHIGECVTRTMKISRGLATLTFRIRGIVKARDLLVVSTEDLNTYLRSLIVNYLYQLYSQTGILTDSVSDLLTAYSTTVSPPAISITSYGGYTVSLFSLIIDIYPKVAAKIQTNLLAVLDILLENELLDSSDFPVLVAALKERYMGYTNPALDHLLLLLED